MGGPSSPEAQCSCCQDVWPAQPVIETTQSPAAARILKGSQPRTQNLARRTACVPDMQCAHFLDWCHPWEVSCSSPSTFDSHGEEGWMCSIGCKGTPENCDDSNPQLHDPNHSQSCTFCTMLTLCSGMSGFGFDMDPTLYESACYAAKF